MERCAGCATPAAGSAPGHRVRHTPTLLWQPCYLRRASGKRWPPSDYWLRACMCMHAETCASAWPFMACQKSVQTHQPHHRQAHHSNSASLTLVALAARPLALLATASRLALLATTVLSITATLLCFLLLIFVIAAAAGAPILLALPLSRHVSVAAAQQQAAVPLPNRLLVLLGAAPIAVLPRPLAVGRQVGLRAGPSTGEVRCRPDSMQAQAPCFRQQIEVPGSNTYQSSQQFPTPP